LEAVLDEQQLTLRDVMDFAVGQTLMLNSGPEGAIDLRCGGVRLGKGKMGRVGNHVAVRVEQAIRQTRRVELAPAPAPAAQMPQGPLDLKATDIKPAGSPK
ncbi:MAG: FliM/FliN family flagellar motor switch protein, partial [Parvibaculum sp.]|nr:FliM/FliN family flagellar motor switch protein [Parvibaculum sp.]